jgi:hypothetical protein
MCAPKKHVVRYVGVVIANSHKRKNINKLEAALEKRNLSLISRRSHLPQSHTMRRRHTSAPRKHPSIH